MKQTRHTYLLVSALSFLVFIIPLILYFSTFHGGFSSNDGSWSNFGSYAGGTISSIFSFASFALILYSLYREKESTRNSERESTFFRFLDLMNSTRENISLNFGVDKFRGSELIAAFNGIAGNLALNQKLRAMLEHEPKQTHEKQIVLREGQKFIIHRNAVRPLVDLISIVLKFIREQEPEIGARYMTIFSSQLSEQEKMAFGIVDTNALSVQEEKSIFVNTLDIVAIRNMRATGERYVAYVNQIGVDTQ